MGDVILPKRNYEIPEKTELQCPVCENGVLEIKEDNVCYVDYDSNNKKVMKNEIYGDGDLQYGFHGVLECENPTCHEKIVFAGYSWIDEKPSREDYDLESYSALSIEYIERPPHLIKINDKIPKEIYDALLESFRLYWIDLDSCANKIRVCLELIINSYFTDKEIPPRPLGERIGNLKGKKPQLKKCLDEAEWVGSSAYLTDEIKENDLCNGYEMLKCVLKEFVRQY